jgi:hypothetical protein
LKSILDKKPLDYSDLENYMTEGQVLQFISKWEYKQVAKDFSEFMANSEVLKLTWQPYELEAQTISYLIQLNHLCIYRPLRYLKAE